MRAQQSNEYDEHKADATNSFAHATAHQRLTFSGSLEQCAPLRELALLQRSSAEADDGTCTNRCVYTVTSWTRFEGMRAGEPLGFSTLAARQLACKWSPTPFLATHSTPPFLPAFRLGLYKWLKQRGSRVHLALLLMLLLHLVSCETMVSLYSLVIAHSLLAENRRAKYKKFGK